MIELTNISALNGYLDCIDEFGINPQPLLDKCGIEYKMLIEQEGITTFSRLSHLLDLTAEEAQCPHFGLRLSEKQNLPIFGMLGLLIEKTADLRSAIKESINYFHLHTRAATLDLEETGDLALLKYRVLVNLGSTKQVSDLSIGTMTNCLQLLNGRHWRPRSIFLSHLKNEEENDDEVYRRILGAPVIYNHEFNAVVFDRQLLDKPFKEHDPTLQRLLKRSVERSSKEISMDISSEVRKLIHSQLAFGGCSLKRIAQQLCMSPRTLQYRLAEQETTFKQIIDRVRLVIAQQQLQQSTIPISHLCDLLGYSDQTAFSRAFKRWFGLSPTKWQKVNAS